MHQGFRVRRWSCCFFTALIFALLLLNTLSAQTLTINGSAHATAVVTDTLHLRYTYSPGETEAMFELWIDLDGNGIVTQADWKLNTGRRKDDLLVDGMPADEDGAVNGEFQASFPLSEVAPVAPATLIFGISDNGGDATAILDVMPLPNAVAVSGSIAVPPNTKNLVVLAFPARPDTMPGGGNAVALRRGKNNRSVERNFLQKTIPFGSPAACGDRMGPGGPEGPRDQFFATLTENDGSFVLNLPDHSAREWVVATMDPFGVLHGYFPPPPVFVSLDGPMMPLLFEYLPTNSQIIGTVRDLLGAPLTDAFGHPFEVEVYAENEFGAEQSTRTHGGDYAMDLLPGRYRVQVGNVEGLYLWPMEQFVELAESDTGFADFHLAKIDTMIHGRVAFKDGTPVPCVQILAKSNADNYTFAWTDQNGEYWLPVSSQVNPWLVSLDDFSLPPDARVQEPREITATAGDMNIDFTLFRVHPAPRIVDIHDIRYDQGLQVRVVWEGSEFDRPFENPNGNFNPSPVPITHYSLWRRGPHIQPPPGAGKAHRAASGRIVEIESWSELPADAGSFEPGTRFHITGEPFLWDFIAMIPAVQFPVYSYVAPTLHDSTAHGPGWSFFMVSAHTEDLFQRYFSAPDSGYSVDNLAPVLGDVVAKVASGGVELQWSVANSPDVVAAAIYRSHSADFSPSPETLLGVTTGENYFDPDGKADDYYRIVLRDDAENQMTSAALQAKTTGIWNRLNGAGIPESYVLDQNYPNPFNPGTKMTFALPVTGHIRLDVFDVMGRHIATLLDTEMPAGYYETAWDGRDKSGQPVSSGVYIYRLQSAGRLLQRKMTLTR